MCGSKQSLMVAPQEEATVSNYPLQHCLMHCRDTWHQFGYQLGGNLNYFAKENAQGFRDFILFDYIDVKN